MAKLLVAGILVALLATWTAPAWSFTNPDAAEIYQKVKKSVIRINNIKITGEQPFFEPMGPGSSGGSGVVFQIDYERGVAYALTNHHVSKESLINSVRFWDGSEYKAYLVATEPGIDTALLELQGVPDERNLPDSQKTIVPAILGDSDTVHNGDFSLAMGAPGYSIESFNSNRSDPYQDLVLQQTLTMRVVAGRETDPMDMVQTWASWKEEQGPEIMTNCPWRFALQTTINPGNSGGPLFDTKAECIGLNHAGGSSFLFQNTNATIPINFAKNFAYQILNTGKYEMPWLGIDMLFPPNYNNYMQISRYIEQDYDGKTLEVLGVRRDSPAQRSGVQSGDIILEFDGQVFPTHRDLRLYMFTLPIGKQVPITFKRSNQKVRLVLEVGSKRNYDSEFSF